MTVMMDIARFVTATSAFLSPDTKQDSAFVHMGGGELHGNWLAWRTGTRVLRAGLAVVLTRDLQCRDVNCYPSDAWFQPHRKLYGCQSRLAQPTEQPITRWDAADRYPLAACADPDLPGTDLSMSDWPIPGCEKCSDEFSCQGVS